MLWRMINAKPANASLASYRSAPPATPTMAPKTVMHVGVRRSASAARATTMPSGRKKYTSASSSISYALNASPTGSGKLRLPGPEHQVPQRRRHAEMTFGRRVVVRQVVLAKEAAHARRHAPAMDEVVEHVVGQIAVYEPAKHRLAHRPQDESKQQKDQRADWQRDDE